MVSLNFKFLENQKFEETIDKLNAELNLSQKERDEHKLEIVNLKKKLKEDNEKFKKQIDKLIKDNENLKKENRVYIIFIFILILLFIMK